MNTPRTTNNLAKVRRTGLNAFGQPYTGNAIRGVVNKRTFSGGSGPLSERKAQPVGEPAAQMKATEHEARQLAAAREAGLARARAEVAVPAAMPDKSEALDPAPSTGGGGWFTRLASSGQNAMLAAARRERATQAAADRKKARNRVYRERGSAPAAA